MWVSGRKFSSSQWLDCCSWTQKPEPKQLCIVPFRKESSISVDVISPAALWRKSVPKPKITRWPKSFGKSVNDWVAFHKAWGTVLFLMTVCELYLSLKGGKKPKRMKWWNWLWHFCLYGRTIIYKIYSVLISVYINCCMLVWAFFYCIKVSNGITIILVGSLLYELWNYIWYESKTQTNVVDIQ